MEIDYMEYANDAAAQAAYVTNSTGVYPDLLNQPFDNLTGMSDYDTDTGVSEISPAGQLRLDTNLGAAGNARSAQGKTLTSPPNTFTIEIKTYFDTIGTLSNNDYAYFEYHKSTWVFRVDFCSDGLFVHKVGNVVTEVGTNIVLCNAGAAWQTWRFQVNKTTESTATVEVFLGGTSRGTVDCDYEVAASDGLFYVSQTGHTTNNMVSHVDYVKIATGLGTISELQSYSESTIKTQGSYSLKGMATQTDSLNKTLTKTF